MITRQSKLLLAAGIVIGIAGQARAQDEEVYSAGYQVEDPSAPPEPYGPPPIPPDVEAQPVAGPGNAFCYNGPHPVDTRVAAGAAWDETPGPHTHFYAPFDLRLFRLDGSCYNFVGDPQDFGYAGQTYSYYGAHPIHGDYGGGWCFMVGGHHHWWQPWSTSFVIVNSWYYWNGPYDRVFWNYWPYYSYYYQSYYPHYYGGGRWSRHRDRHVAPRINHIPDHYARGWRSNSGGGGGVQARAGGWRGSGGGNGRDSGGGWRGSAPGTVAPAPRTASPQRQGAGVAGNGGWRGGSSPSSNAAPPPPPPAPSGGGWRGGHSSPPPAATSGGWNGGGRPAAAATGGGWSGRSSGHAAPPPSPPAPSRMPATPLPSGGWKGGGSGGGSSSSGHAGSARGGWRH